MERQTKIVKPEVRKVRALLPGSLAQFVVKEDPGPQEIQTYAKGEILEIPKDLAESLIRSGRAEFLDAKEAKVFAEHEADRLAECARSGNWLNDAEWKKYYRENPPVGEPVKG